jgi:hypothetical protein
MRSLDPHAEPAASSTRAEGSLRAGWSRAAAAGALALALGGCSVSYPLFSPEGDDIKTGSIEKRAEAVVADSYKAAAPVEGDKVTSAPLPPPPGAAAAAATSQVAAAPAAYAPAPATETPPAITPSDWGYARGALSLAMGADATNASVPWANPDTGAYGSFSASAGPVTDNGATCRPFAASHSGSGREQRLEGTACRTAAGYWEAVAIRTTASRSL